MKMLAVTSIFLFAALVANPQTNDARECLREVSESARKATTWKAEGAVEIWARQAGQDRKSEGPERFRFSMRLPNQARLEKPVGRTLLVCDGESFWTHVLGTDHLTREPGNGIAGCIEGAATTQILPHPTWADLMKELRSVAFAGQQTAMFQGKPVECDVIKAEYGRMPVGVLIPHNFAISRDEPCTRIMWVDRKRNLILRDEVTAHLRDRLTKEALIEVAAVATFDNVERDPDLPADAFRFVPPSEPETGSAVIQLSGTPPPAVEVPTKEPIPGMLQIGYITALFPGKPGEVWAQKIARGDSLSDVRAFLEEGAPYQNSEPAQAPAASMPPDIRTVSWKAARYVVNRTYEGDEPLPQPRYLAVLVDKDGRVQGIIWE